jgi:hypothetical protein
MMKKTRLPTIVIVAVVIVLFGIFVVQNISPRYELLDSKMGDSAWQPTKLLEAISWEYKENRQNPYGLGHHEFSAFQHQALLRLIDIQRKQFGHSAPNRNKEGTYIDHCCAYIKERNASQIVVIGTATLNPCHNDNSSVHGPDPYWQMERLTFSPTGELLFRHAHTE